VTEIEVTVYDQTDSETQLGTYRSVAAPRRGDLVLFRNVLLRVEEVYWRVMTIHDLAHLWHGTKGAEPLHGVTVFGRQTTGPHEP